jgi:hypothetical protein
MRDFGNHAFRAICYCVASSRVYKAVIHPRKLVAKEERLQKSAFISCLRKPKNPLLKKRRGREEKTQK